MTQDDIYIKFMIGYDKANITSSYPSLTKYEAFVLLNKAYVALISQKVTGNNPRRAAFETDIKVTEDLRPLVKTEKIKYSDTIQSEGQDEVIINITKDLVVPNQYSVELPKDTMYYLQSSLIDESGCIYNTDLVTHQIAQMFKQTATNSPWIEAPVVYTEGKNLCILTDPDLQNPKYPFDICITYIKTPQMFDISKSQSTEFELSEQMADELINLAILFATEITESPRLQSKSSILQLES